MGAVEDGISRMTVIPPDRQFPMYLGYGFTYSVALGDTEVTIEVLAPYASVRLDSWAGLVRLVEMGYLKITGDLDVFRAWALIKG
jgi:hypothetical protein